MPFELDDNIARGVNIKVVGVGGGGNNAVNRMVSNNVRGVDFIAINTDKQALVRSSATHKIPIGEKLTKGHGAGANPDVGARAAEDTLEEIKNSLEGADMVFITAGMGGGTGTGAAPVVARIAQEMGILTVGIVTKPFAFEGKMRMEKAERGIADLSKFVDSLVIIPNERLNHISEKPITMFNAFEIADSVLSDGVQSISELINVDEYINLDFADVTAIMSGAGYAHMGVGEATGKDKAELAAKAAISSPLLETSISGATGILINITATPDITMDDINTASSMISAEGHEGANVIWGVAFDNDFEDKMRITIIATGFNNESEELTISAGKIETPAAVPAAAAEAAPADETAADEDEDDDDFASLFDLLKKDKNPGRGF